MPKFETTLLNTGGTTTGIVVPPSVIDELGAGKKPRVVVVLNGYQYRSSVAVMGGEYMIGVSSDIRSKTNLKGGDAITVELSVDTEERTVDVPAELQAILDSNPSALEKFSKISYSNKLRISLAISTAKTPDTMAKRIAKVTEELTG
ncbi:MAG TPA: YdeI/OmpD-associated family protein [Fimbriimonas sp.]|nr:YdeI/OmpD-associated family protein [Fimbriimonas sp.]